MTAMTLNDGTMWEPDPKQVAKWIELYPAVNVQSELNAMCGWLDANPTKRKTKRGISRFCNSWLSRAQDKGGSGMAKARPKGATISTRDMSMLDDLTHDFTDSENFRRTCIAKHGQYFNGERHYE